MSSKTTHNTAGRYVKEFFSCQQTAVSFQKRPKKKERIATRAESALAMTTYYVIARNEVTKQSRKG